MARHFLYTDRKSGRTLFETVQPNYISEKDVDIMVLNKTGRDPRLEYGQIKREIKRIYN